MSGYGGTKTQVGLAALAAQWRAVIARANRPDALEAECAAACDAADALAWSITRAPAASLSDLLAKLRIYQAEIRAGGSAVGDALLASIVADAVRLGARETADRGANGVLPARNGRVVALA
ncbi:MAG: hypothetical protein J0I21_06345 [Alphaproteobacteria bacterium]|nr:hypothetical protein [Alphaproteobacteria bacterium]